MAVRSGAGTGVVVSLVVFILTTFFLLVLTIVFYSKQTKAVQEQANAEKTLGVYIRAAERNNESFKRYEDAAKGENQSVARHLHGQIEDIMKYTVGRPSATPADLRTDFERLGVDEATSSVRDEFQTATRALQSREEEINRLEGQLKSWEDDNAQLRAQQAELEKGHQERLDELNRQVQQYAQSVNDYRGEIDDLQTEMRAKVDELTNTYERERARMQNEIDTLNEERVVLITRIDDLESKVRQDQLQASNPAELVDGRVIDQAGRPDQVFIDRGRLHHIVLGMTFEVYSDAAALRQIDRNTGRLPRGKASIEVIYVAETTSTCKVVRGTPGQPVVRDDVIANAVYDPNYKFKFLIHGKFDVDGDGRPTEAEAEFLRGLVVDWGGVIVTGEELPGDLDFLVLGVEPIFPPSPPDDAPGHVLDAWVRARSAHQTYKRLQSQARDAQIPVLNANRFFILTGYNVR